MILQFQVGMSYVFCGCRVKGANTAYPCVNAASLELMATINFTIKEKATEQLAVKGGISVLTTKKKFNKKSIRSHPKCAS